MPTTCEIDFENNPMKVIYAGQLLRGTVRLKLTKEKNVRGVFIRIHGYAHCKWTQGSGKNRKTYSGNEDYLDERSYFVGGSSDGETHRISPGSYKYTFQCMLPSGLPTSVEGELGYIRYMASVVLNIPLWRDKSFEVPFTVLKAIDLNADPTLKEPVIVEKNKTFFLCWLLCCCPSDPLRIIARTPVGGYAPGQVINLEINVKNESDQPVSEFSVQLIKQITYYTCANSSRRKQETITITEKDERGCNGNHEKNHRVNIKIPAIPPTDFSTSNIVKVKYFIRITGSVACCHPNPVLELPITIGSYPIQGAPQTYTGYQQPSAPLLSNQNTFSTCPTAPSAPFPISNDDPPPNYEEAVHGGSFKPKYPMFKRTTSYSNGK